MELFPLFSFSILGHCARVWWWYKQKLRVHSEWESCKESGQWPSLGGVCAASFPLSQWLRAPGSPASALVCWEFISNFLWRLSKISVTEASPFFHTYSYILVDILFYFLFDYFGFYYNMGTRSMNRKSCLLGTF